MKCVTTKYEKKLIITISFKGEAVDIFTPKRLDSKAAEFENKLKKLDKGMILMATDRQGKDNYLDIDIKLSIKYKIILNYHILSVVYIEY